MTRRLTLLLLLLSVAACADTPRWTVTDLGASARPTAGKDDVRAAAVNDSGQVVGWSKGIAFRWQQGRIKPVGNFPRTVFNDPSESRAYAINNRGDIGGGFGGYFTVPNGEQDASAFIQRNGKVTSFGQTGSEVHGINARGEAVGRDGGNLDGQGGRGFFYANGRKIMLRPLSRLPAGNSSTATAINRRGQCVGAVSIPKPKTDNLPIHACLWPNARRNSRPQDLGTLPGYPDSTATALNWLTEIVGYAEKFIPGRRRGTGEVKTRAFMWRRGKMTALPNLPGRANSRANGINDKGQIVGACGERAVLWERGKPTDLNALQPPKSGWILTTANAINAKGWIVGDGLLDGKPRGFLLRPY